MSGPRGSTLDQTLFLVQSISNGFNKPRPCSRTILSTIDFSKAFDFAWNLFINSFRLVSFFALLVGLNLSFLTDALTWFIKITKVVPFEPVEVFCKDQFLALYFFSLFINDLSDSLPSSVSCSLYSDDQAIWSSSPSVPTAVEEHKEL